MPQTKYDLPIADQAAADEIIKKFTHKDDDE